RRRSAATSGCGPPTSEPPLPEAPLLAVRGLEVAYGPVTAVRGLNLEVAPGEIVALLGANGAGKTSTLRGITGLLRPRAGRVAVGRRAADAGHRAGADVGPHAAPHRRAQPRPVADRGGRAAGAARRPQPRRPEPGAHRAVRAPGAGGGRPRPSAGQGPGA